MTATTAVASGEWGEHVALAFARLDERQRRWVGSLLAAVLGRGGTQQIAPLAGLDQQTIRQGSIDRQRPLADYPADGRVRRPGGGRPPLTKKRPPLRRRCKTSWPRKAVAPRQGTPKTHAAVYARGQNGWEVLRQRRSDVCARA